MVDSSPLIAATALHAALERGESGEALRPYWTDDTVVREYPNRIKPEGSISGIDAVIEASARGAALLSHQRYAVLEEHEVGDLAVVRATWTGVVAADLGTLAAGHELTAHIAQFIRVRDGRISSLATYDCYEPF
jgi:ketosteroid isomerase-like protein